MTKNELKYYSGLKQKKYRDSEKKFLIEGVHLIDECLKSKFYRTGLEKIFIRDDFKKNVFFEKLIDSELKSDIVSLNEKAFNQISETVNSQGIIGVVSKRDTGSLINDPGSKLIAALDSVNDPGNLGTIIRTCYWFGVNELITGTGSADLYNSKVIRATQGALFKINIRNDVNLEIELNKFFEKNYKIILTDPVAEKSLSDFYLNTDEKYVIVFGNEAKGISDNILENCNYSKIRINSFSDCESLNIAVAAGIVLNSIRNK